MQQLRPSFHALVAIRKTPFQQFSVLKTLLSSPNHKFLEISSPKACLTISKEFSFKALNWTKIQSKRLHFVNSVHKGLKFSSGLLTSSPFVRLFQAHTYTKMTVECPRMQVPPPFILTLVLLLVLWQEALISESVLWGNLLDQLDIWQPIKVK